MSRSTRRSTVSRLSLCSLAALSLLATGCEDSNTHSAREVRAALAHHGIETQIESTEVPREYRAQQSAAELRLDIQLAYYASRLAGLAERSVPRANVVGDNVSLLVANDPQDAAFVEWLFSRTPDPHGRFRSTRVDNILVFDGGRRAGVRAALAELR